MDGVNHFQAPRALLARPHRLVRRITALPIRKRKSGDSLKHLFDVPIPLVRILVKALSHEASPVIGDVWQPGEHLCQSAGCGFTLDGIELFVVRLTVEQAVHSDSKRPDVSLRAGDSKIPNFRGEMVFVPRRRCITKDDLVCNETEVSKFRSAVRADKDVRRLDIPVEESTRMNGRKANRSIR